MRVASLVVLLSLTLAAAFGQPAAFNQFTTLIPSGQFPVSAETGDLDKDGKADIVTCHSNTNDVRVFRSLGNSTFAPPVSYPLSSPPFNCKVADVDGDGNLDVVVAHPSTHAAGVLFGNGNGTLGAEVTIPVPAYGTGQSTMFLGTADLNGDQKLELFLANGSATNFFVIPGMANRLFGTPVVYATPAKVTSMAFGNFSGSGFVDVATANFDTGNFSIFPGSANGTLGTPVTTDASAARQISNYESGGKRYMVVAGSGTPGLVSVFQIDSLASITLVAVYPGSNNPVGITTRDFDGDGNTDIGLTDGFSDRFCGYLGIYREQFKAPSCLLTGSSTTGLNVGEINGPGGRFSLVLTGTTVTLVPDLFGVSCSPATGANCVKPGVNPVLPVDGAVLWENVPGKEDLTVLGYDNKIHFYHGTAVFNEILYEDYGSVQILSPAPATPPLPVDKGMHKGTLDVFLITNPSAIVVVDEGVRPLKPNIILLGYTPKTLGDANGGVTVVDSTGSLHDYSMTILTTFTGAGAQAINVPARVPTTGANPVDAATADLNGDGTLDLVTANKDGNNVSVLLRNTDGSVRDAVNYPIGTSPIAVAIGDVNNDGKLDIITANTGTASFSILLGNGNGTFQTATQTIVVAGTPGGIAAADFNLDGKLDLAISINNKSSIAVYQGNGNGTFQTPLTLQADSFPTILIAADVNGDGRPDLISRATGGASIALILNTSAVPTSQVSLTSNPAGATAAFGGVQCTTPCTFQAAAGSVSSIGVDSPQTINASSRLAWTSWSDSGAIAHSITVPAVSSTLNANFQTQYLLALNASPAGYGTVSANPTSVDGYYAAGSVVAITATPTIPYVFSGFSGDLTGATNPQSLTMSTARTVTGNFIPGNGAISSPAAGTTLPAGPVTFSWSATAGATKYRLDIGSSSGANELFTQETTATSLTVGTLPTDGRLLYARVSSFVNGTYQTGTTYIYGAYRAVAALRFVPVVPCRVADTRNPTGAFGGPAIAGNNSRDFAISSSNCVIPPNAQAYSLNVTVVPQGPLGFLTIWPAGVSRPLVSTLNSGDGRVKANAAIVPAGYGGAVSVFVTNTADVILDINGYFVPAASNPTALAFYPLTPCRVSDTRNANGPLGGPTPGNGGSKTIPISSTCSVPAGAQAYSLNFTTVPRGPLAYLSTWPTGQSQPLVSTLNAPTGAVTANAAIVPAGANGSIDVFVYNSADVIIDINGYFAPPSVGGYSLYPVTPCRVADTRNPAGTFGGPTPGPNQPRSWPVPASACGIPAGAKAYAMNVTVVPPAPLSYLTIWPSNATQPLVSTLNSGDGSVVANAAIVPAAADGSISTFVTNATDVILDISGYFAP